MAKNRKHYTLEFKQLSPIKVSEDVTVTLKEYKALQKENQRLKVPKKYLLQSLCTLKSANKLRNIQQKWRTDITCIHVLKERWTYLASVMDLCSRNIIGYACGTSMMAELAVQAVKNACLNVKEMEGIILHSDLGNQYTSQVFEEYLRSKKIRHSFSRKAAHMIMPVTNLFILYGRRRRSIFIPIRILRNPGRQSLNILNRGTTAKGYTVPLIT